MSDAAELKVKELKPVYTPGQITARVKELARDIDAVYGQEPADTECGNDVEEHGAVERVRGLGGGQHGFIFLKYGMRG